jgi:acyl dehydratase
MGDLNPLHADPGFPLVARFEGRPILHGLCTYGFGMRAVAKGVAGGDATRLREVTARFTKPVWPGDTLRTEVWSEGERVWFRTSTRERGEAVLSHGTARLG